MTGLSDSIKSVAAAVNALSQEHPAAWSNTSVRMQLVACRDSLLSLAVLIDMRAENERLKQDIHNYIHRTEHAR